MPTSPPYVFFKNERWYRCLRCGAEWRPRGPALPVTCASCKSPYWKSKPVLWKRQAKGRAE